MLYTIQNESLRITVNSHGAELWSMRTVKRPQVDFLWDGRPQVWPYRAPVLFPWCGKLECDQFELAGRRYQGGWHGFIRDVEHTLIKAEEDALLFRLDWQGDETRWPWNFSFETRHHLVGRDVVTTCTATNQDDHPMPVQLGFHTGLRCPFTPGRRLEDYIVRFEAPEAPDGTDVFPLTPHVFDRDSICFHPSTSRWLQLEEKETGHYLRVDTQDFPYVLLWSPPGIPGFLCIEPWTGFAGPGHDLSRRPGSLLLAPGASFCRAQRIALHV